jgi:transcriptional regulator with XRE-family HTH domain
MYNKKKPLSHFSREVKKRLIELNMTQRELAKQIGMSEDYLTMILTDRKGGQKYKKRIAEFLQLDIDVA